ncbi:MAG: GldG family protein [Alphaproteobacteria bacterium]
MPTRTASTRRAAVWLPPLALGAVLVAANIWAVQHNHRFDLTSGGVYSIGPETRRVIASVGQPVTITFFYDIRSKALLDAKDLLDQYADASEWVTVQAFDPLLQPAAARRYQVNFAGTTVFESGDRRVTVNGGAETDFTNGLLRVTRQAAQRICFTDGHVESDPFSIKTHDHFEGSMGQKHRHGTGGRRLEVHERHGMGMARDALETLGYEVAKVLLVKGPDQLAGCSVVVVASPQKPFRAVEVDQLRAFLARGGAGVFLIEPFVDTNLDAVIADFGIDLERALVIDDARHYWTDPSTPAVSSFARHKITRNLALTFFPGAAALRPVPSGVPNDVNVIPLVESSDSARLMPLDPTHTTPLRTGRQTLAVVVTKRRRAAETDTDGESRTTRLVVVGDGDFATNSFFHILGNGALFLNIVNVLAEHDELVDITPRSYEMPRIRLTNRQMQLTFAISTIFLPSLLLLIGAVVWWRKR